MEVDSSVQPVAGRRDVAAKIRASGTGPGSSRLLRTVDLLLAGQHPAMINALLHGDKDELAMAARQASVPMGSVPGPLDNPFLPALQLLLSLDIKGAQVSKHLPLLHYPMLALAIGQASAQVTYTASNTFYTCPTNKSTEFSGTKKEKLLASARAKGASTLFAVNSANRTLPNFYKTTILSAMGPAFSLVARAFRDIFLGPNATAAERQMMSDDLLAAVPHLFDFAVVVGSGSTAGTAPTDADMARLRSWFAYTQRVGGDVAVDAASCLDKAGCKAKVAVDPPISFSQQALEAGEFTILAADVPGVQDLAPAAGPPSDAAKAADEAAAERARKVAESLSNKPLIAHKRHPTAANATALFECVQQCGLGNPDQYTGGKSLRKALQEAAAAAAGTAQQAAAKAAAVEDAASTLGGPGLG
jgi:hypothetical protein